MSWYIYRITNLINGKTYIGQHKYKKLNDSYMGSGKLLLKAYKKHGIENFKKEILVFNISKKEHIDLLEKTFIASEREKVGAENCYNITDGGEGGSFKGKTFSKESRKKMSESHKGIPLSEEHRKKLSESLKGRPSPMKGRCHTEESRKKISESNSGEKSRFYGKHHSEEIRKKMSESHKGISLSEEHRKSMRGRPAWNKGIPCSEETKRKISEANKGNPGPWEGKQLSEETKRKISEAHKGKHWKLIDGKRVYY